MSKLLTFLFAFFLFSSAVNAQKNTEAVKSIEGIVNELLKLISGDIDEERDWEAYRNLFLPTAQKWIINPKAPPHSQVRAMNIEEFIRFVGPLYGRDGFLEVETGLTINEYNGIANVFQSYHAKNLKGTYDKKGINSYQLIYHQDRWWIASLTFVNESPTAKIPNTYLNPEFQEKN